MNLTPLFVFAAVVWALCAINRAVDDEWARALAWGIGAGLWGGLACAEHDFKGGR